MCYFGAGHYEYRSKYPDMRSKKHLGGCERKLPWDDEVCSPTEFVVRCCISKVRYEFPVSTEKDPHAQALSTYATVRLLAANEGQPNIPASKPFTVLYRPCELDDWIVPQRRVDSAVHHRWGRGMPFRMHSEGEYYTGTVVDVRRGGGAEGEVPVWNGVTVRWPDGGLKRTHEWLLEPLQGGEHLLSSADRMPGLAFDSGGVAPFSGLGLQGNELAAVLVALDAVMVIREAEPFLNPVSDEAAPRYSSIVPLAMHLKLIHQRVQTHYYRQWAGLLGDLDLVVTNCSLYNDKDSEIALSAKFVVDRIKGKIPKTILRVANEAIRRGKKNRPLVEPVAAQPALDVVAAAAPAAAHQAPSGGESSAAAAAAVAVADTA